MKTKNIEILLKLFPNKSIFVSFEFFVLEGGAGIFCWIGAKNYLHPH